MTTATKHPLQIFCGAELTRYGPSEPWHCLGCAVATDGRIMAWMPSEPFECASGKRPDIARYMTAEPPQSWSPLPQVPTCHTCNGTGNLLTTECPDCDGLGELEHECDCDHCTITMDKCEECHSTGKVEEYSYPCSECGTEAVGIQLLGMEFQQQYLHKIQSLGNVEVAATEFVGESRYGAESGGKMLRFRCGDIQGFLMPILKRGD